MKNRRCLSGTAVVKDAAGNDVTAQFDVNKTDGKLTISNRDCGGTVVTIRIPAQTASLPDEDGAV